MDELEPAAPAVPDQDIAPDGDVILVVGPQMVRLRVHSLFLRSSSKVFKAMFGPNWSEGQRLSKESPGEVCLEEDDAEAMRIICYVIHHRINDVPQTLSPELIFRIAIGADKYDLAVALGLASSLWLGRVYPMTQDMSDTRYSMLSAYLFRNADVFARHTLSLVLHFTGPYLGLLDDERVGQSIPWKTFCMLRPPVIRWFQLYTN